MENMSNSACVPPPFRDGSRSSNTSQKVQLKKRTCSEPPKSAKKSLELRVTDVFPGWDCLRVMMNKECARVERSFIFVAARRFCCSPTERLGNNEDEKHEKKI